jgi:hypothetical protein
MRIIRKVCEYLSLGSISEDARVALRQVFQEGILSERVVTYNIWNENGARPNKFSSDSAHNTTLHSECHRGSSKSSNISHERLVALLIAIVQIF